jgi:hypothetical protein
MTERTALETLQEKFLQEVRNNGIEHVFTWIGSWYQELATARLADDIERAFGEHAKNPANKDGLVLFLTSRLAEAGSHLAHRSTGAGTNLLADAVVAVTAKRLEKLSSGERSRQWDVFRERIQESAAPQA